MNARRSRWLWLLPVLLAAGCAASRPAEDCAYRFHQVAHAAQAQALAHDWQGATLWLLRPAYLQPEDFVGVSSRGIDRLSGRELLLIELTQAGADINRRFAREHMGAEVALSCNFTPLSVIRLVDIPQRRFLLALPGTE